MHHYRYLFKALSVAALALVCEAAAAAIAHPLVLSPDSPGDFEYVGDATPELVARMAQDGRTALVADETLFDESVALTNWALNAAAVAFDVMPRAHLMQTWRKLGVTMLQTVRYYPEGTADHFRREAGFLAFKKDADGIWLPGGTTTLPDSWQRALDEAREDWRLLLYLRSLADEIAKTDDGNLFIESRRIRYWFAFMPAEWENLDVLRLECVEYARRLEQLLGLPPATLPAIASPIEPQTTGFMPYSDWDEPPTQEVLAKLPGNAVFDGGLSFHADYKGFSITYSTTNGPPLARSKRPGGRLDFLLFIPGDVEGDFLPYRFCVDLGDHFHGGPRAPMLGRHAFVNGDERFTPYNYAYGVPNIHARLYPRLRDFSPSYPELVPRFECKGNKEGGWRVTLSFRWYELYGLWPMAKTGKSDIWFVGLERSPETGRPLAGRLLWPRGSESAWAKFCGGFNYGDLTDRYRRELGRTRDVWSSGPAERYYPFASTEAETFHRYDPASDGIFFSRVVMPLIDANANSWELIEVTKKQPKPKLDAKPDAIRQIVWRSLGNLLYLSHAVGDKRLEYLEGRHAGEIPSEYKSKAEAFEESKPVEMNADFDPDAIQLEDKEY